MINYNRFYIFDFESNNSDKAISEKRTNVWLWDIYNPWTNIHEISSGIEQFMFSLFNHDSCILYAHNLKFDGTFILSWLLKNGFTHVKQAQNDMEFSTLITDRIIYYNIKVCYAGKEYEFRDSMKKIDGSVRDMAYAYNLPIKKGEIDYKLDRPDDYIATEEEVEYIKNDCEIVGKVMKFYYENQMTRLTTASDTLKKYKQQVTESVFRQYFPVLDLDTDDFIRKSYRGGVCMLNPKYQHKIITDVHIYDVNSMYPAMMTYKNLPYGKPYKFFGEPPTDCVYIQRVIVDLSVKEGHFPTILYKSFLSIKNQYIEDTNGEILELILTSVDIQLMYENYDIHYIRLEDGLAFNYSTHLFKDFIEPLYHLKNTTKGSQKMLYKKLLNSLYGKFAMQPRHRSKIPYLDENGILCYKLSELEIDEPLYTAVACFITAYARQTLFNAINSNIDSFVYCDTDSIHLLKNSSGIEVDNKKLGAWKLETVENPIIRAKYIGQKCYMHEHKYPVDIDKTTTLDKKIASCPQQVKDLISFEDFNVGLSLPPTEGHSKLRPVQVDGGTVLICMPFTLKER